MSVLGAAPAPSRARHARPAQAEKATPVVAFMLTAAPVAVILIAQAFLSVRLLHATYASGDESLYIYSGHQLINELWHGGGSPYYEEWLSGAPVIYPVFAGMLDHVGGLALVRFSSCGFMLIATSLLYATTRRLFGYWPAVVAAGLFAGLGITHGLGALATYDAMALAIMALASYCAVKAGGGGSRWLLVIPAILLLANATKYASILFDPVIIGLAALMLRDYGWGPIAQRVTSLGLSTSILLVVVTLLAGSGYVHGIMFTTLSRQGGAGAVQLFGGNVVSPSQVAQDSWSLIGAVVCLGFAALVVALVLERQSSIILLLALLALAGTLVTLENMHLKSTTSVAKHDDFGIWFTCIAAGYALARAAELVKYWCIRVPIIIAALTTVVLIGHLYTYDDYVGNTRAGTQTVALRTFEALKPYLNSHDMYLLGGLQDTEMLYDDRAPVGWYQYFDDSYIRYPVPGRGGNVRNAPGLSCGGLGQPSWGPDCIYLEGILGYQAAIHSHWFSMISMVGNHGTYQDTEILAAIRATPGYKLISTADGGPTYIYAPDYPHQGVAVQGPAKSSASNS
jgi:hypothetical protein